MATQQKAWTDPTGHRWQLPSQRVKLSFCKSARHKAIVTFVRERANYSCQTCGDSRSLHIDHIIPRRAGGTHHPDNLQVLCASCHTKKTMGIESRQWPTSKYPTSKEIARINHERYMALIR